MPAPRVEAMAVERLTARLGSIWEHRLGLVVAPPGAGKTTLLAAFARDAPATVVWYRADRADTSEQAFMSRLVSAFGGATDGGAAVWDDVIDMMRSTGTAEQTGILLVIDDLHLLEETPAEAVIERFIEHGPTHLHVLAASRTQPRFNLSRLRLSGDLLEISADDLRFRTWEVERLFRDFYAEPMAPEDLARLARWTEGWVAGLQLFHLATRGRPPDERRRMLRALGPRSRLAREYLAQNALDRVPPELRRFLIDSSTLGRLSGHLCDRLLDRHGSEALLEDLERRCLFTTRIDDDGFYRYHEVFRSHLQGVMVSEVGEEVARARFREAGDLLRSEGFLVEALEAYVRAEAWEMVESMLSEEGEAIAGEPFEPLIPSEQRSLHEDPWLGLVRARRMRTEGRFRDAAAAYAAVAGDTRTEAAAEIARQERAALQALTEAGPVRSLRDDDAWWAVLHRGLTSDPVGVGEAALARSDPGIRLVGAMCLLSGGEIQQATGELASIAEREDAEGLAACAASIAYGAAQLLGGDPSGLVHLDGASSAADGHGWEWLARVGRSLRALGGKLEHVREAQRLEVAAAGLDDHWGALVARLARAWGMALAGAPETPTHAGSPGSGELAALGESALEDARALGVPVLEAWAAILCAWDALVREDADRAHLVERAAALAQASRTPALGLFVAALREHVDGPDGQVASGSAAGAVARLLRREYGLVIEGLRPRSENMGELGGLSPSGFETSPGPPWRLHLMGPFRIDVDHHSLDLSPLRPRVRSLLHLLALEAGVPVHRENLIEALWPDAEPEAAARNLHVAVASLRRVLEPEASRGGYRHLLRDGDSYLLSPPPGSWVDVAGFDVAVSEARAAAARGDEHALGRWCRTALDRYEGDLLPEEGPAEWIVARREAVRAAAVEAAAVLARSLLDRADPRAAAATCNAGLGLDRYQDSLWQMLIEAHEVAGDQAAAEASREAYRQALAELGVAAAPSDWQPDRPGRVASPTP